MATPGSTGSFCSPRPTPTFGEALPPKRMSYGGSKSAPATPAPPRPPSKPVTSRFFASQRRSPRPTRVGAGEPELLQSPHYDPNREASYFEQMFENLGTLGEGSYGVVYKVRSREDGRVYAVKRSTKSYRGDKDRANQHREVEHGRLLSSSPHCLHYFEAWEESNFLYIRTEYCSNGSLDDYIARHACLPEERVWEFLTDLLLAVRHMHSNGLLHLDIKPANIFLTESYSLKLGDFGLTVHENRLGSGETDEGDPVYMAKELLDGRDGFRRAADIFSTGITILDLMTNVRLPGRGELWQQLRDGDIPDDFFQQAGASSYSSDLKDLVRWMMDPDPASRPTAEEALAHPRIAQIRSWRRWVDLSQLPRRGFAAVFGGIQGVIVAILVFLWSAVQFLTGTRSAGVERPSQGSAALRDETASPPPPRYRLAGPVPAMQMSPTRLQFPQRTGATTIMDSDDEEAGAPSPPAGAGAGQDPSSSPRLAHRPFLFDEHSAPPAMGNRFRRRLIELNGADADVADRDPSTSPPRIPPLSRSLEAVFREEDEGEASGSGAL